jgi:hypothetical protein
MISLCPKHAAEFEFDLMGFKIVNRAALVVKPKQPYIDWANHFDDGGPILTVESALEDFDVFLIDELENEADKQKVIRKYYKMIFQHELEAWMADRDSWPSTLDLRTLDQSLLDGIAFRNLFGKFLLPDLFMEIHVWASFLFGNDGMTFSPARRFEQGTFSVHEIESLNC